MAKKDKSKCIKCGFRIALASIFLGDDYPIEAEYDQEPYESGVIEPVVIDGQNYGTIELSGSYSCHVCPNCGWVRDISIEP